MSALLFAAILLPLALATLLHPGTTRSAALTLVPWAPLPALGLALFGTPGFTLEAPWLLLGARFGLDATTQTFLFFTAALWLAAGIYARAYLAGDPGRARFSGFFLLTMCGNLGLILAQDVASFYLFFALMTYCAYGLVVHDGSAAARRAARVYLVMAVLGEAMLLTGLLLLVHAAGTLDIVRAVEVITSAPTRSTVAAWLLAGFGVKAGAVLLHLWLPLAHPVAPTPASAVLSGAIIKAGLLGWLRFLPLGGVALPELGALLITAGLLAAFYGVVIGVTEREPKVLLAYSSISQMGLMSVGVGAGLLAPQAWPALLPAVTLYALHHAFAKGLLFLGVGLAARAAGAGPGILLGQLLPALSLAGAPLTSGALAKTHLKDALAMLPAPWPHWLAWLLPLAAVGTSVLMIRFLFITAGARAPTQAVAPGLWRAWWLLWLLWLLGFAWLAHTVSWPRAPELLAQALAPGGLWSGLWPVAAGALIVALVMLPPLRRVLARVPPIPPGDLLLPIERALHWLATARGHVARIPVVRLAPALVAWSRLGTARMEGGLRAWSVAGVALLMLLGLLSLLLARA
ncbi:complex I subunit 5 family protein [Rhodoferax sp.]|uniref:complex I subunit 5 family protein n=1 Tax=Rhodoferax sp. TaxID=50421 RepID=UPI002760FF1B|nr:complex I subunit 5 family protein [Rhodoferax sp.]